MLTYLGTAAHALLARWNQQADRGATAVEYSIVLVAIAGAIIAVVYALGLQVGALFSAPVDGLTAVGVIPPSE